jgi:uncharacterized protein (TIGR00369 family)
MTFTSNNKLAPEAANAVLKDWLALEQLALSKQLSPQATTTAQWRSQTGLQALSGMLEGTTPPAPMGKHLNFYIVHVSQGRVVFQGRPQAEHLNPMGTLHGGWYATILDSALGCAVHTMLPAGRAYTTSQLNLQLVRSIPLHEQRIQAVGEVVHCGRQLATAQGQLRGPDGTLYAHATCTCLIFDLPESPPK